MTRRSTVITFAVVRTVAPTGEAARCLMLTSVPTVTQPGARRSRIASPEVSSICRIIIGVANTNGMPATKWPTVCSGGTSSMRSALMPTLMTSRASILNDLKPAFGRIHFDLGSIRHHRGDVLVEAREHSDIAKGRTLRQDRIDRVEHQGQRHDAARFHLMQHPGGGNAALGGVEHQDLADIGLARELMRGPAEDALDAVEIVAGGEAVISDQRGPAHHGPHGVTRLE